VAAVATENYVATWMAQGRHYRVRFVDTKIDNIHLPGANDVYLFVQRTGGHRTAR
jgi:hypothetical protein